jgi:hypothetical protein
MNDVGVAVWVDGAGRALCGALRQLRATLLSTVR